MQMSGGLGNQMFQYALGRKLETLGRQVVWDEDTEYRPAGNQPESGVTESGAVLRPKMLEQTFGIRCRKASEADLTAMKDADLHLVSRVRRKLFGRHSLEVRDKDFCFDPAFLEREDGYYTGCFQSARYFEGAEEQIRAAFQFREDILENRPEALALSKQILKEKNSVAVHLRFGDYIAKAEVYGGICTAEYYEAAVRLVSRLCPGAVFYVFSNDEKLAAEWIRTMEEKQAISESLQFVPVCGQDEDHGDIDLYLMHLCRHFIIANSSFSWWGAWLGKNREGISAPPKEHLVIAPSLWIRFKDGSEPGRTDIFTEDMIRINPAGQVVTVPEALRSEEVCREETPLITVIVAAYNIDRYIGRALDSLLQQSWRNLEILVVDDGSTDTTPQICDDYAKRDGRIRVIHKTNGGLSDARNAGLAAASGQYIGYLDGDDWADPEMFEIMIRSCLGADAEMALVSYRSASASDDPKADPEPGRVERALRAAKLLNNENALRAYILSGISEDLTDTPFYNSVWSKLFKAETVKDMQFPTGKNSEDILYTSEALIRSRKCCYIPEPLYNYVEDRAGSIMNQKLGERRCSDEMPFWQEQIRMLENTYPDLADLAAFAYYRRLLYYEDEMRADPGMQGFADAMQELLLKDKDRAEELIRCGKYGRKGDRARLALFLRSPKWYRRATALYKKLIEVRTAGDRKGTTLG